MRERPTRRIEWPEAALEAAARWRAGETLPYSVETLSGLLACLGDGWGPIQRRLAGPALDGPSVKTLKRWTVGQASPSHLEWEGLIVVVKRAIPAHAGEQLAPRVGGDKP